MNSTTTIDEGNPSATTGDDAGPPDTPGLEQPEPRDLNALLDQVTNERDRSAAEKAEMQELLLRRQADYENFRKRAEREKAEVIEYASMDACRALLPVLDDFERALKAAGGAEDNLALRDYAQGMELIQQRTLESLTRLGLEGIESVGRPFDPNLHYAVQKVEQEGVEGELVIEEFQRGYQFKKRLLRPAMVKVAIQP